LPSRITGDNPESIVGSTRLVVTNERTTTTAETTTMKSFESTDGSGCANADDFYAIIQIRMQIFQHG
jgi:uncharacterized protein with FMN-binding domain